MTKTPWLKFYPQDWTGDPKLRACSLAARGLWVEMIALAHEASPYGHVLVNGNVPSIETLARIVGVSDLECETLVAELERNGVFSRTRKGVIYSRRMTRDAKKSVTAQKNGKTGGNPTLTKQMEKPPSDNPRDKPQKPEARVNSVPNGTGGEPPLKAKLFGECLGWLSEASDRPRDKLRSLLGKWCSVHGDRPTLDAIILCQREGAVDPVPWIEAKLAGKDKTERLPGTAPYADWTEEQKRLEAKTLRLAPTRTVPPTVLEALYTEGYLDEDTARLRAPWLFRAANRG